MFILPSIRGGLLAIVLSGLSWSGCQHGGAPLSAAELPSRLGQQVTLEGMAINAKLGALLQGHGFTVWLDGIQSWPEGYYTGGDKGRRVRVTGTLEVREDLPVFVPTAGEPMMQGIPVAEGTDLQAARRRYILRDARYGRAK